jgi:RNA polymerase sigma factor (sigma-70 family)
MVTSEIGGLVAAAAGGDDIAWGVLVDRFAPLIWAVARSHGLSTADAADVSQTTWLRLAEHVHTIREPERIAGWLRTTARNESIRILRCGRRDVPLAAAPEVPADEETCDAARRLLDNERDVSLWKAFESLPSRCKTLLRVLTTEPAPSYAEASEVLDIPIGSIGPTRGRCLQHLRKSKDMRSSEANGGPAAAVRRSPG